jgi:hypothetical protein
MRCQNFRSRGEIFTRNAIDLRIDWKSNNQNAEKCEATMTDIPAHRPH